MAEKNRTSGKKKPEELYQLATDLIEEYGERDADLDELEPYYFLSQDQDADTQPEQEGIEVVRLPYASNVVDLVQDLIGATDLSITVPALSEKQGDKKLADTAEAFLRAVLEQSERAQRQRLLGRAAWLIAMRGCVAGRAMGVARWVERGEEEQFKTGKRIPLLLQLRDPRYVYPAFGLDGLAYVVEKRERTVRDIRQAYGDDVLEGRDLKDKAIWIEYWDDSVFCYWADGEPVGKGTEGKVKGPWPHNFGGIPYSYEFARQTGRVEPQKRARPILASMKHVIKRLELLDSAEATFIMNYNGDALNIFSRDDVDYDRSSGAVNYLDPEDRVEWLHTSRQPVETEQAYNKYSGVLQKGTFPESMYGMDPGRIMAGYAINLLNQSGQARLQPVLTCLEKFMEDLLESCLMVAEHWLSEVVDGPIPFFVFSEATDEQTGARVKRREERTLDAEQFSGFYSVQVQLGDVLPADEQSNVVLATRMREPGADGRPLLSWESTVTRFKLASDATQERERIDRELAWNDPRVQELSRALLTAEIIEELKADLIKLDIDPIEVLARAGLAPQPQEEELPPETGGMLPPEMAPPQMQGQLMPQPMGAIPEQGEAPPMMPPQPPIPGGGMF